MGVLCSDQEAGHSELACFLQAVNHACAGGTGQEQDGECPLGQTVPLQRRGARQWGELYSHADMVDRIAGTGSSPADFKQPLKHLFHCDLIVTQEVSQHVPVSLQGQMRRSPSFMHVYGQVAHLPNGSETLQQDTAQLPAREPSLGL